MTAIELGATLYVPALHPGLPGIARGEIAGLRSMVICLEDAVHPDEVGPAQARFAEIVAQLAARPAAPADCARRPVRVYARPRDAAMLAWMLRLPGIEAVRGFVLPKVTTQSLPHWLSLLIDGAHGFMPTIEGEEAFDRRALDRIGDQLLPFADRIDALRIGGNDILNILGIRRSRVRTAYDGPLGGVIRDIAGTFLPRGIAVAAPVLEHYSCLDLLRREVEQDIEHGLLTKTAIHPVQIEVIQACYRPSAAEMHEARAILDSEARAVFGARGSMCEPATQRRWAGLLIARAQIHGVEPDIHEVDSRVA